MCLSSFFKLYFFLIIFCLCHSGYAAPKPNYRLIMRQGTSVEVKYPLVLVDENGQLKSVESNGINSFQLIRKDRSVSGTVVLAEKVYDLNGTDKDGYFKGTVTLNVDPNSEAIQFNSFLLGKIPKLENLPMNTDPEKTVELLVSVLRFGDNYDQGEAAKKLAAIGDQGFKALPEILMLLNSREVLPSAGAQEFVKVLGPKAAPAVPILIKEIKRNPVMGKGAAAALAAIGEPAIPPLITLLIEDDYKWMQHAVHDALSQMGATAVPSLIELMKTNKTKAIGVMLWMKTPEAAALVIPVFLNKLEEEVRLTSATEMLDWLGKRTGKELEPYTDRIDDIRKNVSGQPALLVRCLALLLKLYPENESYQALYLKLLESPTSQAPAIKGVEYLQNSDFVIGSLLELAGTPEHCLPPSDGYSHGLSPRRGNASEALYWLGSRGIKMEHLVAYCQSETKNKKKATNIARIIKEILSWNVKTKEPLIPLLKHPFYDVRLTILKAIFPFTPANKQVAAILEEGFTAGNLEAKKYLLEKWEGSSSLSKDSPLTSLATKLLPSLSDEEAVKAICCLGRSRKSGDDALKVLIGLDSRDTVIKKAIANAIGELLPDHPEYAKQIALRYVAGEDYLLPSLVKAGPGAAPAIDKLAAGLSSKDKQVREQCADALAQIGAQALPTLIRKLSPESPIDEAWMVIMALRNMGEDAIPALPYLARYAAANPKASDRVLWAIRNIGVSQEVKEFLISQAKAGNYRSKYSASLLLARNFPTEQQSFQLLLKSLENEDLFFFPVVGYDDLKPLFANRLFYAQFIAFVESRLIWKNVDVRRWALNMYTLLSPAKAAEFLAKNLVGELSTLDAKSKEHYLPFKNLNDHHSSFIPVLNEMLRSDNHNIRTWALKIFGKDIKGDERTADLLMSSLTSHDRLEKYMGCIAILNLGGKGLHLAPKITSLLGKDQIQDLCLLLASTSVTGDGLPLVSWLSEPKNQRLIPSIYAQFGSDRPELLVYVKKALSELPERDQKLFLNAERLVEESWK